MNGPARRSLSMVCALVLLPAAAVAQVSGSCDYEGRHVAFVDGAAWDPPIDADDGADDDWPGDDDEAGAPAAPPLQLAFTTFPIDRGALARAEDRDDALFDQTWQQDGDHSKLVIGLEGGEVTTFGAYFAPGTSLSRSGGDIGTATVTVSGDQRSGKYQFADEEDALRCTIEFSVAHLGDPKDAPPPPGVALPADGGEPGRAYLAINAALRAGDLDALEKLLPPERVAMMQEARQGPDFEAQLALMKTMAPTDVHITGGRVDGDTAWVEFTAVEFGTPRAGTAELKREGGRWFVTSESTRDP